MRALEGLRWVSSADDAVAMLGTTLHESPRVLASGSIGLCHSGGALEHEPVASLRTFLAEQARVLAPGGLASHVFDHRDHLHHADRTLPFLAHLAWPELAYRPLFAHPLGFHSRLTPTEVQALFAEAGLERIAVRRLIYDNGRRWVDADDDALAGTVGLPRRLLAHRFRDISDPDLRTAAAHYLYRKVRATRSMC